MHLRVSLEDRDAIHEFSKDASDAPDVHRRRVDCAPQQDLWCPVEERDDLHVTAMIHHVLLHPAKGLLGFNSKFDMTGANFHQN